LLAVARFALTCLASACARRHEIVQIGIEQILDLSHPWRLCGVP
jgi:hypothetical protein